MYSVSPLYSVVPWMSVPPTINEAMKIACVTAIADLAMAETSEIVAQAYAGQELIFGPDYLIPKAFDPRLIMHIAPAVAKAAMDSGVATRPIDDFEAYREKLSQFVFRSGLVMRPIFERAKLNLKRVVYAEGEDERVLRTAQMAVDEGIAKPILIGRPDVISTRLTRLGLRLKENKDYTTVNPESDPRYHEYWTHYHEIMKRRGITVDNAKLVIRTDATAIAALMLKRGEADAMICGTTGQYGEHLQHVKNIIGRNQETKTMSALTAMILPRGLCFFLRYPGQS